MKKIKSFIITIIFLFGIFYSINFSFAYNPARCSDGKDNCGVIQDFSIFDSCSMSGGDIYAGNRILGGQVCYTIGGQDFGGYYMYGTGEPDSNTPTYSFSDLNMTAPWGWTYSKSSDMFRYFGGSSITGEAFQSVDSYRNIKFFNPISVRVVTIGGDDGAMVQIGSNTVETTGCNALFTDVKNDNCPSRIITGNRDFNAYIGDTVKFRVINILRPNNGFGEWGSGSVGLVFANITQCYTKAYFDYLCNFDPNIYSYACNRSNYIPTAPGVCSPETKPKAKLNAYWKENNSQSIEKTITQGQSIQIPFIVENIGDIGSVIDNIQCILSNTSLGSISNCPSSLNK